MLSSIYLEHQWKMENLIRVSLGGGMRRDELMRADLLREIIVLGSGVAILVAFVIVVVAALTSAATLQ
jgi:hypothetical protein